MIRYLYLLKSGDLCKIGITDNITKRLKTYTTHNPNFELYREYSTDKAQSIELAVKSMLKPYQVPGRSEWFTTPIDSVVRLIEYLLNESYAAEPAAPKPDGTRLDEFVEKKFLRGIIVTILMCEHPKESIHKLAQLTEEYLKLCLDVQAPIKSVIPTTRASICRHPTKRSQLQLGCTEPITFLQEVIVSCTIEGDPLSASGLYSPRYFLSLSDADPSKLTEDTPWPLPAEDPQDCGIHQELGELDYTNQGGFLRSGYPKLTLIKQFKHYEVPVASLYGCTEILEYRRENWITADPPEESLDNIHLIAVLLLDRVYTLKHLETTLGKYVKYSRPLEDILCCLKNNDEDLDDQIKSFFGWLEENIYDRQPDVDPDFEDQESHFINLIKNELLEIRRLRQHDKVVLNYSFKSS